MGKLAIIGLGLIGGSIGLGLKRANPVNTEVVGYDRDRDVMAAAHKAGAVKSIALSIAEAVDGATMVIVAAPVISIKDIFKEMAPHLRAGCIVTDTASTKTDVLRWAREELPQNIHFVGGHPMAGKEKSGPVAAEEDLFDGRPYAIVPSADTHAGAVNAVVGLAQALQAEPFFLDAEEHDAYAAAVSHVPLVASIALFNLARASNAWPELAGMAGPAFRDFTRLASGNPEMAHDIALTNRENIVHWLDRYMGELHRLRELIDDASLEEPLFRVLAEAQMERDIFLEAPPRRGEIGDADDLPSPREAFMTMMTGGMIQNRANEVTKALEDQRRAREKEARLHRQG
jgi:prephenate dehydrogenase